MMRERKNQSDEVVTEAPAPTDPATTATETSQPENATPTPGQEQPQPLEERRGREPSAWAKLLGELGRDPRMSLNGKAVPRPFSWRHAAAAALHGWARHAEHSAEPLLISREDYEAALKASEQPTDSGEYERHAAAASPH